MNPRKPPLAKSPRTKRRYRKHRKPRRLFVRYIIGSLLVIYLMLGPVGDMAAGLTKGTSECKVVRVVDGDTVTAWCDGGFERIRLSGFDTPEIFSPKCDRELVLGLRAMVALKGALWGSDRIVLRLSGEDRYGRTLARMTVDGRSVGNDLVKRGLARPYSGGPRFGWCQSEL